MNLPLPTHSCAYILGAAGVAGKKATPDTIGQLYAAALRAQGISDSGSQLSTRALIQAFSDLMGCFVPRAKVPK